MARYQPKSKYNIKEAAPGEFIVKKTRAPYFGFYIETSGGKFYAGNDPKRLLSEIVRPTPAPNNFNKNRDILKYNVLNNQTYGKLKKVVDIIPFKSTPSERDYEKGYYTRFFLKRVNERFGYIEVSPSTFKDVKTGKNTVNHVLYEAGKLRWSLHPNARQVNRTQIFLQRDQFPDLEVLFSNLSEFNKSNVLENQMAKRGDLVYRNDPSREYIGPYHVHPEKGPMAGAVHVNVPHALLMFTSDLSPTSSPTTDPNVQVQDTSEYSVEMTNDVSPLTSNTSPLGGGSFSGGGGGY